MLKFLFVTLCLIGASSAQARVRLYTNVDAIQKVLNSPNFTKAKKIGEVTSIEVEQANDTNALQAFRVRITLTANTGVGPRPCTVEADVMVVRDESASAGITASVMLEPVISNAICLE